MQLNALLLSCLLAACALSGAEAEQPVILLTGFEPFGHSTFNTSWNVVKRFEGKEVGGCKIKTLQLKVVYDALEKPLREALAQWKPAAVIAFGEGTATLQIERVARNGYNPQRPVDNAGKPPPRAQIEPEGPEALSTGLPSELAEKLRALNIAVAESNDAGGYVCNECFYRLMLLKDAPKMRGFVHLPVVKPDDEAKMKQLEDGVRALVETCAEPLKKSSGK